MVLLLYALKSLWSEADRRDEIYADGGGWPLELNQQMNEFR